MDSDDDERLSEGSNSLNDEINNTVETTAKSMEEEVPAILMEDNIEDAQMSAEEECPKILQPAFSDIFPMFANMLDIKSFMTLARASKEMYAKCMDDERIKLNVKEEERVTVRMMDGAPQLTFRHYFGRRNINSYFANLGRLKFDISLSYVSFGYSSVCLRVNFDANAITATHNYFKEIGVKSIDRLDLSGFFGGRQGIVPFMKEFNVKEASIGFSIPEDTLSSILQLNMLSFTYSGEISANTLLNVSSTIPKMEFSNMEEMTNDTFTQILWKIQTGPLENLTLNWSAVDMSSFNTLTYDYDDVLPEERPLVFSEENFHESSYWFLHWHGGVTKCVGEGFEEEYRERHPWRYRRDPYHDGYDDDNNDNDDYDEDDYYEHDYYDDYSDEDNGKTIVITKCDPSDYPPVIRPKELVFKELDEKRDRVVCSSANFHSYFEGKAILDPSSTSPLPEERPLLCKGARESYWNFKEDGILEQFQLVVAKVHYRAFDTKNNDYPSNCDNVALAKYIFQRRLKESVDGRMRCSKEQFDSWLEEYRTLSYDYDGPLPEDRPLVFAKTEDIQENNNKPVERRAILLGDGTVTSCSFYSSECRLERFVPWDLPSCLISVKEFKEIVKNAPVDCNFVHPQYVTTFKYSLGLEMFLVGFEDFKTLSWEYDGPLLDDRPLVFTKREGNGDEVSEQRWLLNNDSLVMECEWKNGEVTIRKGNPKKFPLALTKGLVKEFIQGKWRNVDFAKKLHGFFLDYATVRGCLEEFKIVPYAHSGPLPEDRPLIFEKSAMKHVCKAPRRNCSCAGVVLQFWSLCEGDIVVHGSWNEKGAQKMIFSPIVKGIGIPPVLKTKDYLKYLMEKKWNVKKGWTMRWYGEKRDYLAYFSAPRLTKLRTNHSTPLPKVRPLVVSGPHKRWFLRADGTLVHCHWKDPSHAEICVSPTRDVPHCMRHLS